MRPSPTIHAVGTALPEHAFSQEELTDACGRLWGQAYDRLDRVKSLHAATQVKRRHLALPLEAYRSLAGFAEANRIYRDRALELATRALVEALEGAGLEAGAIDHLFVVSTTGIATPSLDAALINRLGLSPQVVRTPIFGLGCAGGAAGIARAADWVRGTGKVAALVAVELCSLTFQRDDRTIANAIATGLFGDGAAAAIVGPGKPRAPAVVASAASFYPDTEHLMGWDVVDSGLRIRLSAGIPQVAHTHVARDVERFLAAQGLTRGDVDHWICHPGGPKVLQAIEGALELDPAATRRSWKLLEEVGNLSSSSVLFLLGELERDGAPKEGALGLLFAMGPGFSSELVLLRW